MITTPASRQRWGDQSLKRVVLLLLYLLQLVNADMLPRASGAHQPWPLNSVLERCAKGLTRTVQPVAMLEFGVWLTLIAVAILARRPLNRAGLTGSGSDSACGGWPDS